MEIKRILIGVDGSANALRAVELIAELAPKIGATVTLLNVIATSETALFSGKSSGSLREDGSRRHPQVHVEINAQEPPMGEERLQAAVEKLRERGISFDTAVELGHPADVILRYASQGYQLVVMGSRGLSSIEGFLMGSVSSKVVHHSKVPTLVVP